LLDRRDLDAALLHRHQQIREAEVALRGGVRPGDHEAPVRPGRPRRPDLLPVDHPGVALEARAGLHVGEVRAGVRLRVALAPDLLAGDDRRQGAARLRPAAERDQRRAEQRLAHVVQPAGRAGTRVLLVEDHLLGERRAPAAVLARPADAGPRARRELLLPGAPLLDEGGVVARAAATAQHRERAGERRLEPCGRLAAEGLVLRAEADFHWTASQITIRYVPYA